jgi:hypothetical protein
LLSDVFSKDFASYFGGERAAEASILDAVKVGAALILVGHRNPPERLIRPSLSYILEDPFRNETTTQSLSRSQCRVERDKPCAPVQLARVGRRVE